MVARFAMPLLAAVAVPQAEALVAAGVSRLLVDATLMDADECAAACARVRAALAGRAPERMKNATSGHLFAPIG